MKNPISLDIETTGLNPSEDSIWSMGLNKKGNTKEWFLRDKAKFGSPTALKNAVMNKWGSKTYAGKSWSDLFKGSGQDTSSAVNQLFSEINRDSTVLIQNANFENKFFNAAISGLPEEEAANIRDKFRFTSNTVGDVPNNSVFYSPPEITRRRQAANQAFKEYTGRTREFESVSQAYAGMMSDYRRLASETQGKKAGAITIELMDITKATFAQAASEGFLSKKAIHTGTNVEFLSQTLLGRPELHTAGADTIAQSEIMERLLAIQGEISSGNISKETRDALTRIRAGQHYEGSRQFLSAVQNQFNEMSGGKATKINLDAFSLKEGVMGNVSVFDSFTGKTSKVPYLNTGLIGVEEGFDAFQTTSKSEAIRDVMRRYKNLSVPGLDMKNIEQQILDDKIMIGNKAFGMEGAMSELRRRAMSDSVGTLAGAKNKVGSVLESVNDSLFRTTNKLIDTKPKHAMIAAGVAAAGAIVGMKMAGSDKKTKELQAREDDRQYKNTLDSQMKTFREANVYHGTSLANWKERTGHHNY